MRFNVVKNHAWTLWHHCTKEYKELLIPHSYKLLSLTNFPNVTMKLAWGCGTTHKMHVTDTFQLDAVVSTEEAPDPLISNGGLRFGWPTIVSSGWKELQAVGFSSLWSPGTSGGPSTASNWRPGATGWVEEDDREQNCKGGRRKSRSLKSGVDGRRQAGTGRSAMQNDKH